MNRKTVLWIALLVPLSACVTTGRRVGQEQLSWLKEGSTTYEEVIAKFGEPNQVTRNSDGSRLVIYSYAQAQIRPESFLPLVGGLLRGTETESTSVQMIFDQTGVLKHYTHSSGSSSTGSGLLSGQRQR